MAYKLSYFNKSSSRFLYIGKNILRLNKKPLNLIGTFSLPLKKEEKDKGRSKDLTNFFWNQTFDKGRLKTFVLWFLEKNGEHKTIRLVEELKNVGFEYATKAGISLGVEDLKIPKKKYSMMMDAEELADLTIKQYKRNEITAVEKYQRLIETWHRVSETLKQEVIANFEATDILNPVYMMAFSGARGNISQVRQLVGMRGLMSNPNGQIIDFPIRSNFREGLTLTEYIISSYGARKGIVDTALRTANAGYLTRRLVDVAQHVIISNFDCHTRRGIFLTDMKEGNKIIYSLQARLVGRFLARDIINKQNKKIANRNTEISLELSNIIAQNVTKVFVRSSLTCETKKLVCQLCYGWSLAQGNLVSIGEAIGVIAAQSIGEPGTQLTMRTFHTGGVFSGDMTDQIKANFTGIVSYPEPIAGTLIRTPEGKIAFLTKNEGSFLLKKLETLSVTLTDKEQIPVQQKYKIPFYTLLFLKNGEIVYEKEVIAQISYINRQKISTDYAQLTIKADFAGQFHSNILNLKENKVGPKLKEPDPNTIDYIFESWGWGYAWILSGKIYQLNLPGLFFPLLGDYLTPNSFMNKIEWNTHSNFSGNLKLNSNLNKKLFNQNLKQFRKSSKLNPSLAPSPSPSPEGKGRGKEQNLFAPSHPLKTGVHSFTFGEGKTKLNYLNQNNLSLVKNQIISFQLSKIIYKKIGYFLELNTKRTNDNFLLLTPLANEKIKKNLLDLSPSIIPPLLQRNEILNEKKINNFTYPVKWKKQSTYFLNWFPDNTSIQTGSLIIFQPLILQPLLKYDNNYLLKQKILLCSQLNLFIINKELFFSPNFTTANKFETEKTTEFLSFSPQNESINYSSNYLKSNKNNGLLKINKIKNYYPTAVSQNYLKNKILQSLINKHKSFESFSNTGKVQKIIFEQSHERNFGIIFYTSENYSKNKSKTEILNIGLNFRMNYQLNSEFFSTSPFEKDETLVPLNKLVFKQTKISEPNEFNRNVFKFRFILNSLSSAISNQVLKFKRVGYIKQPFLNFTPQINKNLFFNPHFYSDSHILGFRKLISKSFYLNEASFLIQSNRQGKIKNINFMDKTTKGYFNFNHEITNSFKNTPLSLTKQKTKTFPFPFIFGEGKREGDGGLLRLEGDTNLSFNTNLGSPLYNYLPIAKENSIKLSYLINIFLEKKVFSLASFDKNLIKNLKQRNIFISLFESSQRSKFSCFSKSTSIDVSRSYLTRKNLSTLQNFSKITSFPYFLPNKSSKFLEKNLSMNSVNSSFANVFQTELKEFNIKKEKSKTLFLQYFLSFFKKKQSHSSLNISPLNNFKLFKLDNKLYILVDKSKSIANKVEISQPVSFRIPISNLNLMQEHETIFIKDLNFRNLMVNFASSTKIKINDNIYCKKSKKKLKIKKLEIPIFGFINKLKVETVCSPYLKDQFKYFFETNPINNSSIDLLKNKFTLKKLFFLVSNNFSNYQIQKTGNSQQTSLNYKSSPFSSHFFINLLKAVDTPFPKGEGEGDGVAYGESDKKIKQIVETPYLVTLITNNNSLFFNKYNLVPHYKFIFQDVEKIKFLQHFLDNVYKSVKSLKDLNFSTPYSNLYPILSLKNERQIKLKMWLKLWKFLKYKSLLKTNSELKSIKFFLTSKEEDKKSNCQSYFNKLNILNHKSQVISTNLIFKPGWVYFSPEPISLSSPHFSQTRSLTRLNKKNNTTLTWKSSKLNNIGQNICDHFIFDNNSVYLETIKLDQINLFNLQKSLIHLLLNLQLEVIYFNKNTEIKLNSSSLKDILIKKELIHVSGASSTSILEILKANKNKMSFNSSIHLNDKPNQQNNIKLSKDNSILINVPLQFSYILQNKKARFQFSSLSLAPSPSPSPKGKGKGMSKTKGEEGNPCSLINGKHESQALIRPNSSQSFTLIRKISYFELFKNTDYKKELYKRDNKTKKNYASINFLDIKSRKNQKTFINKGFESFQLYLDYKTPLLNKQKITSRVLSKHPSSEIKIISNINFYDSIFKLNNEIKNDYFNSSINYSSVFTSIRSNNLYPIIVGYESPYSVNFLFKKTCLNFSPDFNLSSLSTPYLKLILSNYLFRLKKANQLFSSLNLVRFQPSMKNINITNTQLSVKRVRSFPFPKGEGYRDGSGNEGCVEDTQIFLCQSISALSSILLSPIFEFSLIQTIDKSIFYPNNLILSQTKTPIIWNLNNIYNKKYLSKFKPYILGSLNQGYKTFTNSNLNKEALFYSGSFSTFENNQISSSISFLNTYSYSPFEGEFIYKQSSSNLNNNLDNSCLILTKLDLIAYSFLSGSGRSSVFSAAVLKNGERANFNLNFKETFFALENLKLKNNYFINNMIIQYIQNDSNLLNSPNISNNIEVKGLSEFEKKKIVDLESPKTRTEYTPSPSASPLGTGIETGTHALMETGLSNPIKLSQIPAGLARQTNKLLVGNFLLYGDQISYSSTENPKISGIAVDKSGQIIHLNNRKITLRKGQPIFISPQAILYKANGEFINQYESALTLSYQQLKTGDIIQGIPKVEQFFEARTTKTGRLFRESLTNLLKLTFKSYKSKLPLNQAVRQSFYKIQQIIIDGVHRVYRSQGVSITDKHLEVIVKQMTSKVRIIEGGQTGFFSGEIIDLQFIEHVNTLLLKQISYEPIVLGITKASLEVESFLSAASFQQTTKVLSRSALYRKSDFLRGLKENVILGNLMPAGTGYLVYLSEN